VDAEMARGLLPGALALSGKVRPAVSSVAGRTAVALREFLADPQVPGPWARGTHAAPSASRPLVTHVRPAPALHDAASQLSLSALALSTASAGAGAWAHACDAACGVLRRRWQGAWLRRGAARSTRRPPARRARAARSRARCARPAPRPLRRGRRRAPRAPALARRPAMGCASAGRVRHLPARGPSAPPLAAQAARWTAGCAVHSMIVRTRTACVSGHGCAGARRARWLCKGRLCGLFWLHQEHKGCHRRAIMRAHAELHNMQHLLGCGDRSMLVYLLCGAFQDV